MASDKRWHEQLDYGCALQRAIEYHCRGKEVPPEIGKKCPHHARLLNKCKETEGDKSYTDTLNRLFPWGCETESGVVTELVRRIERLERDANRVDTLLNTHWKRMRKIEDEAALELARRTEELTRRVKKLEGLHHLEKED